MAADPRGRWFRVYSRQVLQHDKFRDLSHAELGAWLDLRAAVDLIDEPLADRTEAVLRLRRRTKSPAKLLNRLIECRLIDVLDDGRLAIHDLDDHDGRAPSDDPERIRERVARHRASRNGVTSPLPVTDVTALRGDREEKRGDADADAAARLLGLNGEDDPLTVICSLIQSASPIEDKEFRAKVDDQTRRYGKEWVTAAYRQAYADAIEAGNRPRQWDLRKAAEVHLAAWTRAEELRQVEAQHAAEMAEREQAMKPVSPEEQERQELTRKAVGVWIRGGRKGDVPEDVDGLRSWLAVNGAQA